MAYRYGGEELLIIMPEQSAETSVIAMERVREAVEQLAIPHAANRPYGVVTISVGLVAIGQWRAVAVGSGAESGGHGAVPREG